MVDLFILRGDDFVVYWIDNVVGEYVDDVVSGSCGIKVGGLDFISLLLVRVVLWFG